MNSATGLSFRLVHVPLLMKHFCADSDDTFDDVTEFVSVFTTTQPKKDATIVDKPLPTTKQEAMAEYKRLHSPEAVNEHYSYLYLTLVTEIAHSQ